MSVPVFSSIDFAVPAFGDAVQLAVDAGLAAAAILDASGKVLAVAGALEDDEARAIAAHATHSVHTPDLLDRMRAGELIRASFADDDVRIGIAARCMFFVVVLPRDASTLSRGAVENLRSDIAQAVHRARTRLVLAGGSSGGSSSGPAELPVIEVGVTARARGRN